MNHFLKIITELRKERDFLIDTTNRDRYRIVINEPNGTKTAYYFSTPIYNINSRKLIDLKFTNGVTPQLTGSNAQITFSDNIRMSNTNGNCWVMLRKKIDQTSEFELREGDNIILPTSNGFVYKVLLKDTSNYSINIKTNRSFLSSRSNNKCFAWMIDEFTPFVYISAIGIEDDNGYIVAPFTISEHKISDYEYEVCTSSHSSKGKYLVFEINMYEKKLIQDTTVESSNPNINNAFGSTAYLGITAEFGEQWLYSRIDYMRMSDISGGRIKRVIAYLPRLNNRDIDVDVFKVVERFCSFGSTWDNKKSESNHVNRSYNFERYVAVDITDAMIHEKFKQLVAANGLIFKPIIKNDFVALTTGDSCFLPQIVEINYY